MPQKQFLPFITDDTGRSLTAKGGTIVTSGLPRPQEDSPEGWEKNVIQLARNNQFRALFKFYTTPLKFFLDSAQILREYYYKKSGVEAILYFIWLKLNQAFGGGMKYESWYKGEIDFSTFKDMWDGVQVNITEGGFYKDLTSQKDKVQEIPVEDDDTVNLYMDGIVMKNKFNYEIPDQNFVLGGYNFLGITYLNNEGASVGIVGHTVIQRFSGASSPNYVGATDYFLDTTKDTDIHFKFDININAPSGLSNAGAARVYLHTQSRELELIPRGSIPVGVSNFPFDFNYTVLAGEHVFLVTDNTSGGTLPVFITLTNFTTDFETRKDATIVPCHTCYNLGNKLTKKISKNVISLDSPYLQNNPNYPALLLTSGDALRGLPGSVIKTKYTDYHTSVDALNCIALEIVDNNPSIKDRYDKFNNTSIAALGECRNWTLNPALDYMYDSIEVGYPKKDPLGTDNVNGKLSFNNTFTWKTPVTRVQNTYKAVSVYFSDPYVIESFRINFDNKTTTDSTSDNDVFWLDAEPKTDINFSGAVSFFNTGNEIKLSGAIDDIFKFIHKGAKLKFTGSPSNDGIYTVTSIVSSAFPSEITVQVREMVAVTELAPVVVQVVNLYQLRRKVYAAINGVPANSDLFNIELSPGRILRHHYRWIKSGCEHMDTQKITFDTTDKNADLETIDINGVVINEKADILISQMGDRVYLPHYMEFEVESMFGLFDAMKTNNSGHLGYTREGISLEGFPIDVKTNEATLETQAYRLLATANNDLTQLIKNR